MTGRWGNMEEVIRYLLLLNRPENSDFFFFFFVQKPQLFQSEIILNDSHIGLFYYSVWMYLFAVHLSINPSVTVAMQTNKPFDKNNILLNNLISFSCFLLKKKY